MTTAVRKNPTPPAGNFPPAKWLSRGSMVAFILFLLVYVAGSIYSETFLWGVHQLAFFGIEARLALLLLSLGLALPQFSTLYVGKLESLIPRERVRAGFLLPLLLVCGGIGTLFFFQYRISTDMYGDSRTLLTLLLNRQFTIGDLFGFNLTDDAVREPLTRLIHQSIARIFALDQKLVFQIVSSLCGGIFLVFFPYAVLTLRGSAAWKLFFLVAGLSAGANQLFFGHVEDYTLVYLLLLVCMILAWKVFDGQRSLPLLVVLFLVGTRLHMGVVLLIPALLYLFFYSRSEKHPGLKKWIQPRAVLIAVGISLAAGTLAYFFLFKADRMLVGSRAERGEKVFLPLFDTLPAQHGYTLLSLKHFSDIFQELLLTVSPGAVILLALGIVFYRRVRWSEPRTIFFGLAAFYFMLFNLTVNPLLTPERDWDLLSLAAVPVIFFAVALSRDWFDRLKETSFPRIAVGVSLALGLLSCSIFYVNSNPLKAGQRLRSLGIWTFNSYYLGSAYLLNVGSRYTPDRPSEIIERMRILRELEPSKSSPDPELGFLDHKLADALYLEGRYDEAGEYYSKSLHEDPYNASAIKGLTGVSLHTGRADAAVDFIGYYNDNINGRDIVDLDALLIAEKLNYLRYLLFTRADSAQIVGAVQEINLEPRE
jgi:tetratricopeptide (TPR) repeat protein